MTELHGWYTQKMDYVITYPHDPVEREIYMYIPIAFKLVDSDIEEYVLKLQHNNYGHK